LPTVPSGHGQVLDDQQVEDGRGLGVGQPVEVGEHLGDDSRGADPADAPEEHGLGGPPPKGEADQEAGREIGEGIDDTGHGCRAQAVAQLVGAVFEADGEEQQQHPDLAGQVHEVGAHVEGRDASLPHEEPGHQVEGNGRDAETTGDPRQRRQHQHDAADLDEGQGRITARGGHDRCHASPICRQRNENRDAGPGELPCQLAVPGSWQRRPLRR